MSPFYVPCSICTWYLRLIKNQVFERQEFFVCDKHTLIFRNWKRYQLVKAVLKATGLKDLWNMESVRGFGKSLPLVPRMWLHKNYRYSAKYGQI
jgi:hypothetical protein